MSYQQISKLTQSWSEKMLMTLYDQSVAEETGIAFDSLRVAGGPRIMLVFCATSDDSIGIIERAINPQTLDQHTDWENLSLMEFAMTAGPMGGMVYEEIMTDDGKRHAIALAAVGPEAVKIIETLFEMPA